MRRDTILIIAPDSISPIEDVGTGTIAVILMTTVRVFPILLTVDIRQLNMGNRLKYGPYYRLER